MTQNENDYLSLAIMDNYILLYTRVDDPYLAMLAAQDW